MKNQIIFFLCLLLLFFYSCHPMKEKADLVIYNGIIYTMDSLNSMAEAMAVKDGKILAVGHSSEITGKFYAKQMIDAKEKPVYPGFIDAHCHFYGLALNLQYTDLTGTRSFDEVLARIKSFQSVLGDGWIVGRGWDQNLWKKKEFPDRKLLDEEFPDRPVMIIRIDGHTVLANQLALDKAGIGMNNKFKPGEVEIKNGRLTGILSEEAADLMRNTVPEPDDKGKMDLLKNAQEICFGLGLTAVSDAGLEYNIVKLIDSLQAQGLLKIHVYAMLNPTSSNFSAFVLKGPYLTKKLTVSSIKLYADGSLGSRTALMKQPYSDAAGITGILVTSPDSIKKYCQIALANGYQVNTHCIGDSAVKLVLDIYGSYLKEKNDRRWRIEHAQVVDPGDMHLFGRYSVIPSVQATHATSDMYWAEKRVGKERIKGAYAYKQLMQENGWLANGTDFPIEQVSPLLTFYAAVLRKDMKGNPEDGFQPENGISREEALRSITIWAAKANFDEKIMGSLEAGKRADFVILDKDIMKIPLEEILQVKVLKTLILGEVVDEK
jgi:predicted amidohydrolase YtcJ